MGVNVDYYFLCVRDSLREWICAAAPRLVDQNFNNNGHWRAGTLAANLHKSWCIHSCGSILPLLSLFLIISELSPKSLHDEMSQLKHLLTTFFLVHDAFVWLARSCHYFHLFFISEWSPHEEIYVTTQAKKCCPPICCPTLHVVVSNRNLDPTNWIQNVEPYFFPCGDPFFPTVKREAICFKTNWSVRDQIDPNLNPERNDLIALCVYTQRKICTEKDPELSALYREL